MKTSTGEFQTIVLFGGLSEIGLAILDRCVTPATTTVVLACRNVDAGADVAMALHNSKNCDVQVVYWDASYLNDHDRWVAQFVTDHGDIDLAVMAAGVLGDQDQCDRDPNAVADVMLSNSTGPSVMLSAVAQQMRVQAHGTIVVLSSVAAIRMRAANATYGASKAGLDAFVQGLQERLHSAGVELIIVRPGFVRGRMTQGLAPAPFSTTPEHVADAVWRSLRAAPAVVWVPGILRWVFAVLRILPSPIWRRVVK